MSIHARLQSPLAREGAPIFVKMREWAEPGLRHKLVRWWGPPSDQKNWLPWIMLNPSTADGNVNDPTLLRIIKFTYRWGFDGLLVFNVYPFRTPSPAELAKRVIGWGDRSDWDVRDTIWGNHASIAKEIACADAAMMAWGAPAGALGVETDGWVEQLFDKINAPDGPRERTLKLWCLGKTSGGGPTHPMARGKHRIPDDTVPTPFPNPGTVWIGEDDEAAEVV